MLWVYLIFGLVLAIGAGGLLYASIRDDFVAGQAGVGEAFWVFVCILLVAIGAIGLLTAVLLA